MPRQTPSADADFAIIGAGLAGLSAALALSAQGHTVHLFDKARGAGGRLSTRRAGDHRFDHGGQYLTVRDAGLRRIIEELVDAGHAAPWDGHVVRLHPDGRMERHRVDRFVGLPGMSGLAHGLAARLPPDARPRLSCRVAGIGGGPGNWRLDDAEGRGLGHYRRLVLALPAPQAADLLRPVAPTLAGQADGAVMAPCWALMLAFDAVGDLPAWDGAFIAGAGGPGRPLSWIARDGSKPGRGGTASFVAHAAPDWSARHLEAPPATLMPVLLAAFRAVTGIGAEPLFLDLHRWRYALPTRPLAGGFLLDGEAGIGVCGDWCLEARAEAAFVSGRALAMAMMATC
ncbi:NAD(P)/FAD-dependent oxidoreductase [Niveispirillum fermenti]|uniref:NAD(P)/FAD-dependent oxidoreductase n=1 Tax=Niveispirillum fermenti TaxID=1233113 RepID=UPI003A847C2D